MKCRDCREQLSARLDGEDDPGARAEVDAHLTSCAQCRRWLDSAARITRLARTTIAHPTPDLVDAVFAQAPRMPSRWLRPALRLLLAVLGLAQLGLGLGQVLGSDPAVDHPAVGGATMPHLTHEFAAWNIALGVGFVWIAWRTTRATGLIPTLAAFVMLLTALEVGDLAHGRAEVGSLMSHTIVQLALIVVLALATRRLGGDGLFPGSLRRRDRTTNAGPATPHRQELPDEDDRDDSSGLRPTARQNPARAA